MIISTLLNRLFKRHNSESDVSSKTTTLTTSRCDKSMILLDLLEVAFQQYRDERHLHGRWDRLNSFFYNKDECLTLLYHILDLGHDHYSEILPDNLYRCQHTFVTFLLGWAIAKRYGLLDGINVINTLPDEYLWILTSLVHDYGYIKAGIAHEISLEELDSKYRLLSDACMFKQLDSTKGYSSTYPQFMTYSYDTISNYYIFRHQALKLYPPSKDYEANDHGIYGACKCYEEYCDFYIKEEYPRYCITPSDNADNIKRMGYDLYRSTNRPEIVQLARTEPLLYKTACLISAQHNMFRSSNSTSDLVYEKFGLKPLLSTEPIAIDKNSPLLFLLSLVDTIECTKRFEKIPLKESGYTTGIPIQSVLKSVRIQLDDDGIIIDYSSLHQEINNCDSSIRDTSQIELNKQISNVIGLKDWVKCETRQVGPYIVKVLF